jgi:DNA-binding NarL/FixJ family response regulator
MSGNEKAFPFQLTKGAAAWQRMKTLPLTGLVAEESNFHRGGIATMLQMQFDFENVIQVSDETNLSKELEKNSRLDLIVVDLSVLGANQKEALQRLKRKCPRARVVVFTPSSNRRQMLELFAGGANGVIPSDTTGSELFRAFEIIQSGGVYVPYTLRHDTFVQSSGAQQLLSGLTDRQKEVLFLLSQGYPNKIIARKLGISPSTVKVHVHALFRALGVHTRMGAVAALNARVAAAPARVEEEMLV